MHLMFDAYLSYTQINRDYLPLLLGAGLLLGHADGYYTATEKGMRFLRMYDEIRDTAESKTRK